MYINSKIGIIDYKYLFLGGYPVKSKKEMTEGDIKLKYITPAIQIECILLFGIKRLIKIIYPLILWKISILKTTQCKHKITNIYFLEIFESEVLV